MPGGVRSVCGESLFRVWEVLVRIMHLIEMLPFQLHVDCFWRYPLNVLIDPDKTWEEGLSEYDLVFVI